ncbi:MAG: acyltransferase [Flavobacteriales bacterium]|nr:acyltransferase [Flavobacteriales bacterium]
MAGKQPINQLYILRFLGAIVVVAHHYGRHLFVGNGMLFELINNAGFILSFFFALSGYVIGYNYFEPQRFSRNRFLVRRMARLVPLYLLAFVATLVSGMILENAYPRGLSIIVQALCMHAWFPSMVLEINYPSWSVSVEFFFYFLFPILVVLLRKRSFTWFMGFGLLLWLASSIQHLLFEKFIYDPNAQWTSELILYFPLWHINSFVAGMAGAEIFKRIRTSEIPRFIPPLIGILAAGSIVWITGTDNIIRPHIHNGLLSPLIIIMLVAFSLDRSVLGKLMASKPMVFLGNLTFAIYILQHAVYLWTVKLLGVEAFNRTDFTIYMFALLVVSTAIYKLYEAPVRDCIVQKGDRRLKNS